MTSVVKTATAPVASVVKTATAPVTSVVKTATAPVATIVKTATAPVDQRREDRDRPGHQRREDRHRPGRPASSKTATAPVASVVKTATAPVTSVVKTATAPVATVVKTVTAPVASIVKTATAPVATVVKTVTAPVASVVKTVTAPVASVVKTVIAPVAGVVQAATVAVPVAHVVSQAVAVSTLVGVGGLSSGAGAERGSADGRVRAPGGRGADRVVAAAGVVSAGVSPASSGGQTAARAAAAGLGFFGAYARVPRRPFPAARSRDRRAASFGTRDGVRERPAVGVTPFAPTTVCEPAGGGARRPVFRPGRRCLRSRPRPWRLGRSPAGARVAGPVCSSSAWRRCSGSPAWLFLVWSVRFGRSLWRLCVSRFCACWRGLAETRSVSFQSWHRGLG